MYLDQDDSMGLALGGGYETEETNLVLNLVRPGQVVLDIGANIGYYTLIFARLVGPTGHVIAFEPDPASFALLQRNIDENKYGNVTACPLAVSNVNAILTLYRDRFNNLDHRLTNPGRGGTALKVEAVRLDDFLPSHFDRPIDLIKMDIQGSEGLALDGMRSTLARDGGPLLLTEYWPLGLDQSGTGAEQFLRELEQAGYRLFDIMSEQGLSKAAKVEDILARYPVSYPVHTNLLCRGGADHPSAAHDRAAS
jgi:FkbM family methyltransferase